MYDEQSVERLVSAKDSSGSKTEFISRMSIYVFLIGYDIRSLIAIHYFHPTIIRPDGISFELNDTDK